LNDADSEGFHDKLNNKLSWLKQIGYFTKEIKWFKTLMLDRATPGMIHDDNLMAFDLNMLEEAIKSELGIQEEPQVIV
jgi:hypothetical protein